MHLYNNNPPPLSKKKKKKKKPRNTKDMAKSLLQNLATKVCAQYALTY